MFEKESNIEQDFTTINLDPYNKDKQQPHKCPITCNPIVIFILLGTLPYHSAFLFITLAVLQLISNFSAIHTSIPLTLNSNNIMTNPLPAYINFPNSQNIGIYLHIQKLTQYDHLEQIQSDSAEEQIPYQLGHCHSYRLNKQIGKTTSINGTPLNPDNYAIPCGYFPALFPLASLTASYSNNTSIPISSTDLVNFNPNDQNSNLSLQWVDLNNPLFLSWMQQNVQMSTFKLIGHINSPLQGQIFMSIALPQGLPRQYLTQVTLTLQDTKIFGHSNIFFVVMNFIQGAIIFFFAFAIYTYSEHIKSQLKESKNNKKAQPSSLMTLKATNKSDKQPTNHMIQLRSISQRDQIMAKSTS